MASIIEDIRRELIDNADEAAKKGAKRFFKEEIELYGVKGAIISKISKKAFKSIKDLSKGEIFELCEQLWASGIIEEAHIACNWSYAVNEQYSEEDFCLFENWIDSYVSNWAICDSFCNHSMGAFLERFPSYIENLKGWTASENRWVRRAAAVSFIIPAKKGLFKEDILEIADRLLLDTDDLVQKGYGWMLKTLCNNYEEEIYQYVLSKREIMPRTALRYAIEKMPPEMKQEAMKRERKKGR